MSPQSRSYATAQAKASETGDAIVETTLSDDEIWSGQRTDNEQVSERMDDAQTRNGRCRITLTTHQVRAQPDSHLRPPGPRAAFRKCSTRR